MNPLNKSCRITSSLVVISLATACGGGGGGGSDVNVEVVNNNNIYDPIVNDDDINASERQNDCRRIDVLRVGLPDPGANLVQFPDSVLLPEQADLRRQIEVPDGNLQYFDSLVVSELGTIGITHVDEGPENTVMELFELNTENMIVPIAGSGDFDVAGGRAEVSVALLPGVYCFYIADAFGVFSGDTQLTVDYSFTPP